MCIIVAKDKKAKLPKKEYLENCFNNNSDGAGLMYVDKGEVVIEKGFMTYKDFEKKYDSLCKKYNNFKNKCLVMHFRIGTQGNNDAHTCHPFPISSKHNKLRKAYIRTDVGMVHNGIISDYTSTSRYASMHPTDKLLSDTQLFIRYCVASFKSLNRQFYKNKQVMDYLNTILDGDKAVFLSNEDKLYTLGDFIKEDGVLYSNDTYSYDYSWYYTRHYGSQYWSNYNKDFAYEEKDDDTEYLNCGELDGYSLDELDGYVTPIISGDTIQYSDGAIRKVTDDDTYYYDYSDMGVYRVDSFGILNFIDYGVIS